MWNTYRQCQLHLTNLLFRLDRSLARDPHAYDNSRGYARLPNEVHSLVDGLCASIPFMLAGERLYGNTPTGSTWPQARPPTLLGGLNLQWVVFTVSILEVVPMDIKLSMKLILLWIGKNLGLRHATVLAQACPPDPTVSSSTNVSQMQNNLPGGITAKGDALRWTGFFL